MSDSDKKKKGGMAVKIGVKVKGVRNASGTATVSGHGKIKTR